MIYPSHSGDNDLSESLVVGDDLSESLGMSDDLSESLGAAMIYPSH